MEQSIERKFEVLKSVRDALVTASTSIAGRARIKKKSVTPQSCAAEFKIELE